MKIKDIRNVKINNYVDFNNYDLTLNEVEEYIDNLDLDNIEIGAFNLFHFKKYIKDTNTGCIKHSLCISTLSTSSFAILSPAKTEGEIIDNVVKVVNNNFLII